jgi:hypothetical protein
MGRLLNASVLLVAGVVGLGFYRDWFHLSTHGGARQVNVTVTLDQDKIWQDEESAIEKLQGVGQKVAQTGAPPSTSKCERSLP